MRATCGVEARRAEPQARSAKTQTLNFMKLYEFEGKQLFRNMGIPIPEGDVAASVQEAQSVAARIGYPVVLKSQILGGGRGKSGGIQFAETEVELKEKALKLLGATISMEAVEKLLIEKKVDRVKEFYAGITLDPKESLPILMVSSKGGIDVEEVAQSMPEQLHSLPLDPTKTIQLYHLLEVASKTGSTGKALVQITKILQKLQKFIGQELKTVILALDPKEKTLIFSEKEISAHFRKLAILEIKIRKNSRRRKNVRSTQSS